MQITYNQFVPLTLIPLMESCRTRFDLMWQMAGMQDPMEGLSQSLPPTPGLQSHCPVSVSHSRDKDPPRSQEHPENNSYRQGKQVAQVRGEVCIRLQHSAARQPLFWREVSEIYCIRKIETKFINKQIRCSLRICDIFSVMILPTTPPHESSPRQ